MEKWYLLFNLFDDIKSFYFITGAGAQEENLHRRTNMFQCLEDPYQELEGHRDWDYHVPEVNLQLFVSHLKFRK